MKLGNIIVRIQSNTFSDTYNRYQIINKDKHVMGTHSDNNNYFNLQGELTLLHYKDILTHWDMRMIHYVIYSVRSTHPPLVISYPNLIPEHTYLWN